MATDTKKGLSAGWILVAAALGALVGWFLADITYTPDTGCLDVCFGDRGFDELVGAFLGGCAGLLAGFFAWGFFGGARR